MIERSDDQALRVLTVLRFVRDAEPLKWDALIHTEAGVEISKLWDDLRRALLGQPPINSLPTTREVCSNMGQQPPRRKLPNTWTPT